MAALTGNSVASSYTGLLKTTDNAALGATEKNLTDGAGNASTLSLGTASASFTGDLDLSGATVTGLPAGAAGLESGSGTDSMQSAASLTTTPANASSTSSIALGNDAVTRDTNDIAIGNGAETTTDGSGDKIAIGTFATASHEWGVAVGRASKGHYHGVAVGYLASNTTKGECVSVGRGATTNENGGVALGSLSVSNAVGAVALGQNVTAAKTDTVSVKALETQTPSTPTAGGIVMVDAGSTERRINIDASGNLQIDGNSVAPSSFTAPYFTHTGQDSQDIVYSKVTIPGGTFQTGDVLNVQALEYRDGLDNWVYSSLWISDTAQTVGSAPAGGTGNHSFGQWQSPNNRDSVLYDKTMFITSAGTMIQPYAVPGQGTNLSGDPSEFYNIDWTIDQHFFFQMWVDATVGTIQVGGISITKR